MFYSSNLTPYCTVALFPHNRLAPLSSEAEVHLAVPLQYGLDIEKL
jgi:hypothetical protein